MRRTGWPRRSESDRLPPPINSPVNAGAGVLLVSLMPRAQPLTPAVVGAAGMGASAGASGADASEMRRTGVGIMT